MPRPASSSSSWRRWQPDFAALQTAISGTVTTLQNADVAESSKAELQQAFADAPSCESLRSES